MPILNPDTCYTQQPKRLASAVATTPAHYWLTDFYEVLSTQLQLNDDKAQAQENYDHQTNTWVLLTKKEFFLKALNRHLWEQSTYPLKPQLLDSFCTLYFFFSHPQTTDDKRFLIASRIADHVEECTPGFTNQVNYLITLFNMPQNLDDLIAQVRFKLVDRIARLIAEKNAQGIHVHNRVIEVAQAAGFGVWPMNTQDVYVRSGSQHISDTEIISRIQAGFCNHFQLFALLNALCTEIEALIVLHGYQGKRDLDNDYKKDAFEKFCECVNLFIPILIGDLLETDEKSGKVTDINWQQVKYQLLQKLKDEHYVTLSPEEGVLLNDLWLDENKVFNTTTLSMLIPHGYELIQSLEFFSEWSMAQKAALVGAYLKNKSPNAQKEVLAIFDNDEPQLMALLKKEPNWQTIYFAIALAEKEVATVRAYIEQSENINAALLFLFSPVHKRDTLFWLHEHPHLMQAMTAAAMNNVIEEGKYQDKTIAETLVSTKKGRQLLLENVTLQTLFAQTTIGNRLSDFLRQAETERGTESTQEGFFKKPLPLATQLGQLIVYGYIRKSNALLQANQPLLTTLLAEKVTVIDYSRRKIKQKTAFQAALCAMDAQLCAMLVNYMSQEEIVRQYQEIFPKGQIAYYQAQIPFDFSQIVEVIRQSSQEDVNKALSLELPNNTFLWGSLEQFRADFTKCSSQEEVFNPQHLFKAFELYENQLLRWSENRRALFWRQVVGYIQRFLPANIAMDFAQGLYHRVEEQEKSVRLLKFRSFTGSIFPLVFDSLSGLGYEVGVDAFSVQRVGLSSPNRDSNAIIFAKLISSKNSSLWIRLHPEAARSLRREKQTEAASSCCLIM